MARWLVMLGLSATVASGCSSNVDACNARIPNNVHLMLVDATTQAPVRGFAQVERGVFGGYDDCTNCAGCASLSVFVTGPQTVWVTADGYAPVTLQLDGGSGSGTCGHTFKQLSQVVPLTPQPGATGTPSGIVCTDMTMQGMR
jgi:hypothetical protein